MKRRIRWTEENPDFSAFEKPEPFAGPPCLELQDASAGKGLKAETAPPAKKLKGEEGQGMDVTEGLVGINIVSMLALRNAVPLSLSGHIVRTRNSFEIPSGDGGDSDSESDVTPDVKGLDTEKERKKAGLPALELDSLPSASANKMLTFCLNG